MAADYKTKEELMKALSPLDPAGRAAVLANSYNRVLALNYGANVTMVEKAGDGLENTFIYVVERVGEHGEDGLGALGGLSERTKMAPERFAQLTKNNIGCEANLLLAYSDPQKKHGLIQKIEALDFDKINDALNGNYSQEKIEGVLNNHLNGNEGLAMSLAFIICSGFYDKPEHMFNKRGKELLLGGKDDIVSNTHGDVILTSDIKTIAANTVRREMLEELSEIGLGSFKIDASRLHLIKNDGIKDDGYILETWNGDMDKAAGIYAVTPFCHTYNLSPAEIIQIRETKQEGGGYEIGKLNREPLLDMLERFGKKNAEAKSDLTYNFKYPHEYISVWEIASSALERNPDKLVTLAETVQKNIAAKGEAYKIDFAEVAKSRGVKISDINTYLEVPAGTVERMQAAIDKVLPSNAINKGGEAVKAVEQVKTVA